jgi:hypothetical protein
VDTPFAPPEDRCVVAGAKGLGIGLAGTAAVVKATYTATAPAMLPTAITHRSGRLREGRRGRRSGAGRSGRAGSAS